MLLNHYDNKIEDEESSNDFKPEVIEKNEDCDEEYGVKMITARPSLSK